MPFYIIEKIYTKYVQIKGEIKEEMEKENKNLKLYPKYRQLSMDFLFFYTINVLFLTQIKHIDMASVVLVDTCYALFVIIWQMPTTILVEKIGRKKGMILGNISNATYLLLVINATNLITLICAELLCAFAFALKDISEPAILNNSINSNKEDKSKIFAKIQSKAVSGYYILSAISLVISGFLFEINGYVPMFLSLAIVIITLLLSTRFEEVTDEKNKKENKDEVSLKEAVKFVIKSKRCRCLIIFSGVFYGIVCVLATYEISLLENMGVTSKYIGIIFAILNIVSSLSSRSQQFFQNKFKNRTLTFIGLSLTISCIISGAISLSNINKYVIFIIIFCMYIIKYMMVGLYNVLLIKYLSNFTNSKIDTKIFAVNNFNSSIISSIFGLYASNLLNIMEIQKAMIVFGLTALIIIAIVLLYMRKKVGLDPKEYSDLELKYEMKVC